MKKRILALALAGTTAFSVFGAAISANAATVYWGNASTHIGAQDSAYYTSYTPAGNIRWNVNDVAQGTKQITNVDLYSPVKGLTGTVASGTKLFVLPGTKAASDANGLDAVTELKEGDGIYFADLNTFMTANGFSNTTASSGTITYSTKNYVLASQGSGASITYYLFTEEYWNANTTSLQQAYTKASDEVLYYTNGTFTNFSEGIRVVTNKVDSNAYNNDLAAVVRNYSSNSAHPYYYIKDGAGASVTTATNLTKYAQGTNLSVVTTPASTQQGVYTDAGYSILDAVNPEDIDAILANPVSSNGVVYLYDYYQNIPGSISADAFATAWANGTVANTMRTATNNTSGTIAPVNTYQGRGIRAEVMYAWEDFLDKLGIANASNAGLTAWAKQTIDNYAYQYKDANIITSVEWDGSKWVITWGGSVNLYNFDKLIGDILDYAPANAAANAQTSELVYLMQQYDKYVNNGFVDVKPVETDNWGDLLMSLVQAPTEEDFRTEAAYKRYTSAGDSLVKKYTDAATSVAVSMAEANMYDFVTSYNSAYTVSSTKLDQTALTTAIDNTYFNANWKNVGEVYGGTLNKGSGILDSTNFVVDTNYKDNEKSTGWALYPAADYTGTVSGKNPGVDTAITGVSSEYFWFYNVYDLAYNVYRSNKYQSVVDTMATALDEAVAALAPTYGTAASTILRAEEQNDKLADLVETDYTTSMWANRNKINTFINDRVSNSEIGSVGSSNAAVIANQTASLLGWQKYQTVVTKSDITSVKTAQANANAALTALRNDQDNYNAAQANALVKAIDNCQYIIDLYNGVYGKTASVQSVNTAYNTQVGDKDQILKSMITAAVEEVDAAINFSNVIQGWSKNEAGKWQYGTEEGYLANGWNQVDGGKTWFYFNEDGTAKQSEWWNDNGTWYWFNSNCGAATGWAKVDGEWYFFKGNNAMKTGWEKVDGNWYYMASSGKMVTGWCEIGGKWYYFSKESNSLGQMLYNTTVDGYKLDANGVWVK